MSEQDNMMEQRLHSRSLAYRDSHLNSGLYGLRLIRKDLKRDLEKAGILPEPIGKKFDFEDRLLMRMYIAISALINLKKSEDVGNASCFRRKSLGLPSFPYYAKKGQVN